MNGNNIISVSEINERIKFLFDNDSVLQSVYCRGEISNYKLHSSGHHYMTLKDEESVIGAVMFRYDSLKLKFKLENGMKIIAHGRVSLFSKSGQYQLYINEIIPDGDGALNIAYLQLRSKLHKEGLFNKEYKKPLPQYPERIALVTSITGAAVRDMLRILSKRYPLANVIIYPVHVQGAEAPPEICEAIRYLNKHRLADVIITGRGGGSIEDLWAFNDENVARAIFASEIPVISAVGHEPDITIADYVADVRAATPSNAAEIVVPESTDLLARLKNYDALILTYLNKRIEFYRHTLKAYAEKRVLVNPMAVIEDKRMLLNYSEQKLINFSVKCVSAYREKFITLAALLDAMSPIKVLSRGYSIVTDEKEKIIIDAEKLNKDDILKLKLYKGSAVCKVVERLVEKNG